MPLGEAPAWRPQQAAVARNLMIDAMTGQVVRALDEAGVSSLLLKGPVIASRLYGRAEIRPYDDCDLLIRLRDLAAAEAVLGRLGMARDAARGRLVPEWQQHAHHWVAQAQEFTLDLHWTLVHIRAEPDVLWDTCVHDAVPMQVGGTRVRAPADPQLALIVALHAAQHGGDWTRPREDLLRAVSVFPTAVWRAAAHLATAVDASAAFAAGLRLTPSGEALASSLGLPEQSSFEVLLSTGLAGEGAWALDRFLRVPGAMAKTRVAIGTAFPSRARMRATRRIASRGRAGLALAYAMQPLHVVTRFGRGVRQWRMARRATAPHGRPRH